MRPPSSMSFGPPLTKGVKILLGVLAVFSVGLPLLGWANAPLEESIRGQLFLVPGELWRGHFLTLLTFIFVARDPLDLLLTAVMLWMFGSTLEQRWGLRRFL